MSEQAMSRESAPREAGYEIRYEPCTKRVRIEFNGVFVVDSTCAIVLHETRAPPMNYFPVEDVRMERLEHTPQQTHRPFKGNASCRSLKVAGKVAEKRIVNPTPQSAIRSSAARLDLTKPMQRRGGWASPRDGGCS